MRQQSTPRSAPPLAHRLRASATRFLRIEASGGIVLLAATALALAWANSPWSHSYFALWRLPTTLAADAAIFSRTLEFWVNEGLMTIFFLVVGLEIRREIAHGTLSSLRAAMLPVVAAVGGMIAPALIFLAIDHSAALWRGWAVPTATDIAFAVGILALLGPRVPRPLRAFLLALAIIDDIGAILVIAVFYSHGVAGGGLAVAAMAAVAVPLLERLGIRGALVYAAAGIVIWIGLLESGVHPTLTGVILGFLIPANPQTESPHALSPGERLEKALHPWVAYAVMPIFALANAGIVLHGGALDAAEPRRLALGIAVALLAGKPLGIIAATLAFSRWRPREASADRSAAEVDRRDSWGDTLPRGLRGGGILLAGCLGGIGFTMSIFIAGLAFAGGPLLDAAKLGILIGSACAALLGLAVGHFTLRAHRRAA